MSPSLPTHPRVPRGRSRLGAADLLVVERATALINDLGADLDRQLGTETRESERLRMLRETTNRITRVANDAVQAYARAQRAITAHVERTDADVDAALLVRANLHTARRDLLRAIDVANRRYPWTDTPERGISSTSKLP